MIYHFFSEVKYKLHIYSSFMHIYTYIFVVYAFIVNFYKFRG